MTDDHARRKAACSSTSSSHSMPGQVEMIGWLVEQQDVGALHQRLHDREALLPASRERRGLRHSRFDETGTSKGLGKSRSPLRLWHGGPLHRGLDDRAHRVCRFRIAIPAPHNSGEFAFGRRSLRHRVSSSPARIRSKVDLPEPLGPMSPMRSPSETVKETF